MSTGSTKVAAKVLDFATAVFHNNNSATTWRNLLKSLSSGAERQNKTALAHSWHKPILRL